MTRSRRIALACAVIAGGLACPIDGALAASPPTKLVKGPYVTGFTDTTADVRFELDAPGPATVEVTPSAGGSLPARFADTTVTATHLIHVTGLQASKSYAYSVLLGTQVAGRGSVTAAPDPSSGAPFRFIVYGDTRSDATTHEGIVRAILATPSDFLVNTGDIVAEGGSASDWQSFFSVEAPLLRERPLLLCIGNHELYEDEAGGNFARYFGFPDASGALKPYGSVRIGNTRIFFLNGMHDWSSGEERVWLDRELSRADSEPGLVWRMVAVHHSPWSSGPHGGNPRFLSARLPELLDAHKVDLLFAGHDHIYERGDDRSLKYIISGGGGAPLYKIAKPTPETRKAESAYHFVEVSVTPTEVRTVAHRLDGTVLEKCGFQKGQPWDCDPVLAASAPPAPAPAMPARPAASSRCGVANPGHPATDGGAGAGLAALAVAAGALLRRRRADFGG
jgi:MYXO-CTERM domain-containing protein